MLRAGLEAAHARLARTMTQTASALLLVIAATGCSDSSSGPATPARLSTTYVFGASLDDTGNACTALPAACPPLPYLNGRFSNGSLWVEIVARNYGGQALPALQGGTNYAYASARTGPIAGTTQLAPNMLQQVDLFLAAPAIITGDRATALFVVNGASAGNDITDAVSVALANPAAAGAVVTGAVTNLTTVVTRLYAAGARNLLLANSIDMGRTPQVRTLGPLAVAAATQLSAQFNSALAAALPALRNATPGMTIYLLDLAAFMSEVFAAPATFGFTNVTTPCVTLNPPSLCANQDAFFFWDTLHPTNAAGRLAAQRAIALLGQ
jgi:outer membrane lipase/esterase